MALVIEDGTIVDGADSFATVAEARAYAAAHGLTLPAGDPAVEILLRNAADFINSLEDRFQGRRMSVEQTLAFPRECVYIYGSSEALPDDEIPALIIKAQCQLCVDANTTNLQPNGTGREVIRTKVDVIETEYAKQGSNTVSPEFNKAMSILAPLFKGSGFALRTIRV